MGHLSIKQICLTGAVAGTSRNGTNASTTSRAWYLRLTHVVATELRRVAERTKATQDLGSTP